MARTRRLLRCLALALGSALPLGLWIRVHRGCPYSRVTPLAGDPGSFGYWCDMHKSAK